MSASRFCPNCGRPVPWENSFCAWCGNPMQAQAPPPAAGVPTPPGAPPAAPPPGAVPPGAFPPGYPPPAYVMPAKVDFGSLLTGTFDLWGKNFSSFFLVYLVLTLVTGALGLLASFAIFGVWVVSGATPFTGTPTTTDLARAFGYELLVALISWLFASIVLGGVVDFSVRRHRGENVRIRESLNKGVGRVLSIMGANLLVTLITFGILILWVFILAVGAFSLLAGGNPAGGIALVCGGLVALPFVAFFVVYVDIALSLFAPAIMAEGTHAVDSLHRSWALTKGHKWSIFWTGVILVFVSAIIDAVFVVIAGLIGNPVVGVVVAAISAGIVSGWIPILTAVAYDEIIRRPQPSVWPPTSVPPAYMPPPSPPQ